MITGIDPDKNVAALRELVLWCREQQIQAQALRVGEVEIQFLDPQASPMPDRKITRGVADDEGIDPDDVDQKFANELGVTLERGNEVTP
jgi:hypothetical protein